MNLIVDSGQLVVTSAASLSCEYRYTLNVVITDFTGDLNLLMVPVLLWLASEGRRIARRDDGSLLSVLIDRPQNDVIRLHIFTAACTTDY